MDEIQQSAELEKYVTRLAEDEGWQQDLKDPERSLGLHFAHHMFQLAQSEGWDMQRQFDLVRAMLSARPALGARPTASDRAARCEAGCQCNSCEARQ